MTPYALMKPTLSKKGGFNSAENVQESVEPSSGQLWGNILAWAYYIALHASSETTLLDILGKFVTITSSTNHLHF